MPRVSWQARPDGLYWIDIALGSRHFSLMIDIGLVDAKYQVGFSIDPRLYDVLKRAGEFSAFSTHSQVDASGRVSRVRSGLLTARLVSPITQLPVGPPVHLHSQGAHLAFPIEWASSFSIISRAATSIGIWTIATGRLTTLEPLLARASREYPSQHIRRMQLVELALGQDDFRLRIIGQEWQQGFVTDHEANAVRQRAEREGIDLAADEMAAAKRERAETHGLQNLMVHQFRRDQPA